MNHKKYWLVFLCGIFSILVFLREARAFDLGEKANLTRKINTFRSSNRQSHAQDRKLHEQEEEKLRGGESPELHQRYQEIERDQEITTLWKTAFKSFSDFKTILNHLIGAALKDKQCGVRQEIVPGDNPCFSFSYKKMDHQNSKERVLMKIKFMSDFSGVLRIPEKKKKADTQESSYTFFSLIKSPLKNQKDNCVLEMIFNSLNAVFINTPAKLSFYRHTQKLVRKIVILEESTNPGDKKGIIVEYRTNFLENDDFELELKSSASEEYSHKEDRVISPKEDGVATPNEDSLPKDSEYLEHGVQSDEEDSKGVISGNDDKEESDEGEYLWVSSNS